MDEAIYLVCPKARPLEPAICPGATKHPCQVCEALVWFAPSAGSLEFDKIICIPCAQAVGIMQDEPEPMTEAQRLEVARETGLHNDELDREWRRMILHYRSGGA